MWEGHRIIYPDLREQYLRQDRRTFSRPVWDEQKREEMEYALQSFLAGGGWAVLTLWSPEGPCARLLRPARGPRSLERDHCGGSRGRNNCGRNQMPAKGGRQAKKGCLSSEDSLAQNLSQQILLCADPNGSTIRIPLRDILDIDIPDKRF